MSPDGNFFFHDEFDGNNLNTTNWEALNRQNSFNNEKQYYRPEQVTVSNGTLQITATNQPLANKLYRSGLITSKALYGPGRFEASIDLPTTQGMWPAFWLNANQVSWPQGGEVDIMENRGSQPTITSSAFHWQKDPGRVAPTGTTWARSIRRRVEALLSISRPVFTNTPLSGTKMPQPTKMRSAITSMAIFTSG